MKPWATRWWTAACITGRAFEERLGHLLPPILRDMRIFRWCATVAFHTPDSFQVKCATAPFLGGNIGNCFGEVPPMATKILSVVLAFSIGMVLWFRQDDGTVPPRTLAVTARIFDANLNDVRIVGRRVAFGDGETALSRLHLNAMIGDSQADSETKGL